MKITGPEHILNSQSQGFDVRASHEDFKFENEVQMSDSSERQWRDTCGLDDHHCRDQNKILA